MTEHQPHAFRRLVLPGVVLLMGAAFGWLMFQFGSYHFLGAAAKLCTLLIGSAWVTLTVFATKVADITESPALSPDEHRVLEWRCRRAVRRVWTLSAINFLCAVLVLVPAMAVDGHSVIYEWMLLVAGAAAGFAVYSLCLHAWWQEELRAFRSDLRLRERENDRLAKQKGLFSDKNDGTSGLSAEMLNSHRACDWPNEAPLPH